ncbi:MAG TPA: LysR family transcriptional regulator, partial [Methylomirabilota bacterium]|nr:LysR family transcriptional regulator [Methylomirabilota bacterium]
SRYLRAMELVPAHVRTFQEIVRHASFSRAAETLHLSQPAVSHHIRHLEETLGTRILERIGRRARPTAAGELLLAHAGRAFAELEAARQAIHRLRGVVAGRVRLGTGATASIYLLPEALRRLRARHPDLDLAVVTGNSAELAAAVAASELDVAVLTLPVTGRQLLTSPFCVDVQVAIAAPGQAWPRRGLRPTDLAETPLILYERGGTIRRVVDEWFRRGRVRPRIAMELGNAEAIKRLVAAGLGVSIVSAVAVQAETRSGTLVTRPLEPPLRRRLAVVRRRDRVSSPALDAVLAALGRGAAG